jgi:hypothetical protein
MIQHNTIQLLYYRYFEVKMTLENTETVEEILYVNNKKSMNESRGDQWSVEAGERRESVKADQITQSTQVWGWGSLHRYGGGAVYTGMGWTVYMGMGVGQSTQVWGWGSLHGYGGGAVYIRMGVG